MKLLRKQTVSQSGSHETTLRSLSRPKGMKPYPEVFISWLTCFIFAINYWNFNDFKQGEAHSCTSRVADWASKLENLLPKNIQILFCAERLLEWQREFAVKENRLFLFQSYTWKNTKQIAPFVLRPYAFGTCSSVLLWRTLKNEACKTPRTTAPKVPENCSVSSKY